MAHDASRYTLCDQAMMPISGSVGLRRDFWIHVLGLLKERGIQWRLGGPLVMFLGNIMSLKLRNLGGRSCVSFGWGFCSIDRQLWWCWIYHMPWSDMSCFRTSVRIVIWLILLWRIVRDTRRADVYPEEELSVWILSQCLDEERDAASYNLLQGSYGGRWWGCRELW